MIKTNNLMDLWPTLDASQKREIVLTVGYDMIEKYGVEKDLQTIEFELCYKQDNRAFAAISFYNKKMWIFEKPRNNENVWNNPLIVFCSASHEIGHIYQRRINEHDVYYDDKSFFVACGEEDEEIFCEIIAISIMNDYFKLYEMRNPFVDEFLNHCLVYMIKKRNQYEKDLLLLSNSKMDESLGEIISKCKKLLIDPYFNNIKSSN